MGRRPAPVKKTLYSLSVVAELLRASNRRYLEFLSSLDDDAAGRHLDRLSRSVPDDHRSYRASTSSTPTIAPSSSPSPAASSTSAASSFETCDASFPLAPARSSHVP
jgi:hypothetical protein